MHVVHSPEGHIQVVATGTDNVVDYEANVSLWHGC